MERKGKAYLHGKAIECLLSETSIEKAAKKCGIAKSTLIRWMRQPEFRTEFANAKADILKMAGAILARNSTKAAVVLAEIFTTKKAKTSQASRVSAAIGVLRLANECFELEAFDERLRRLEEALAQND
jgi:transposase-like protein